MTSLILILALNLTLGLFFRWWSKRTVRRLKLERLEQSARKWQQTGYLVPLAFYWHESNPVLLWRRLPSGEEFQLEIE